MNNIYAKTVHKEYSTQHELHPITSARRVERVLKAFALAAAPEGLALTAFALTKRRICKIY